MLRSLFFFLFTAVTLAESPRDNLHLGTYGLLQIPPSFGRDGIFLYPAHHPAHESSDLDHLTPSFENLLYYSQEGHRPSLHGAKHGSLKAKFNSPTVVLDHTSHLRSIQCGPGNVNASFSSKEAFDRVYSTWKIPRFTLITYHVGCGDRYQGKRSFFRVTNVIFEPSTRSAILSTTPIEHEDAIESGEVEWGTFIHPDQRTRTPVKGHVRLSKPEDEWRPRNPHAGPHFWGKRQDDSGNMSHPMQSANGSVMIEEGMPVDLNDNATALINFFGTDNFDLSDPDGELPPNEEFGFADSNGTVPEEKTNTTSRRSIPRKARRAALHGPDLIRRHQLYHRERIEKRGVIEFFQGLYNGIKALFESVEAILKAAAEVVAGVAKIIITVAVVAAKLIGVAFGVPFDHSYHNDFKFDHYLKFEVGNRPPKVFGQTDGFNLAGSGKIFNVQCVKCGIHGDFTVDGRLAFSIQNGITEGRVSLVNNDPFTIDAVFGITVEVQHDESIKGFSKQLAAIPLSPLTIPGIFTLGPQLSISGALDLVLNGKADLLIGGGFSIAPGTAALDLVRKENNKLEGFQTKFEPVFKFTGTLTALAELGLPVAIEVGVDLLNGRFKKTVGLVEKPSVYASASTTNADGAACKNGVDLRVGVKNRIFVQALDLWDYDLRTDILYEHAIGCVGADGFAKDDVKPDTTIIQNVTESAGKDIANELPNIDDVAANLTEAHQSKTGFRIIMDEDKSSILVTGKDGYIYLASSSENYDASAPWGSIDMDSSSVDVDVFGRILSGYLIAANTFAEIRVWNPSKLPENHRASTLTSLKVDGKDSGTYGVYVTKYTGGKALYYPTFCETDKGLRMFATREAFKKDGKIDGGKDSVEKNVYYYMRQFGVQKGRKCRTVRLTSILTS